MKFTYAIALLLGLGIFTLATTAAFTEDEEKKPLTPAEMEAKLMALSATCPAHEHLKMFVGSWKVNGTGYSHTMGEYPIGGEAVTKAIWDGRFLSTTYEGPGPAGPIYGAGHMGYDRLSGKYVSTWMMSMGTQMSVMRGAYDAKTKAFTFTGTMKMPDGSTWDTREVVKFESTDKFEETHYMGPAGGKLDLTVKLLFTRKAEDPKTGAK